MGRLCAAAVAAMGVLAGSASATWSIVVADMRTGEVGVASATCLTNFDLRAESPVLLIGVGAGAAQSAVDQSGRNRTVLRDALADTLDPAAILAALEDFDGAHRTRQYGIADVFGRTATFTGSQAADYASGVTGRSGDLVYAIQGNILTGAPVIEECERALIQTPGTVADKLMAAMEFAALFGGDGRCSCDAGPTDCGSPPSSFTKAADIGYVLVGRAGDGEGSSGIVSPPVGFRPTQLVAGDLNGDGLADAAVQFVQGVRLYASVGEPGASVEQWSVAEGSAAGVPLLIDDVYDEIPGAELLVADGDIVHIYTLEHDALVEVATVRPSSPFGAPSAKGPYAAVAADFQGTGALAVYLSVGTPYLAYGPAVLLLSDPARVMVAGDVSGDGLDEVALVLDTDSGPALELVTHDSSVPFAPPIPLDALVGEAGEPRVALAELDGSPGLEAIVSAVGADIIVVVGDPTSPDEREISVIELDGAVQDLTAGDVDGDGAIDAVIGLSARHGAYVLRGGVTPELLGPFATPASYRAFTSADVTDDGAADLLYADFSNSGLRTLVSTGRSDQPFAPTTGTAAGDYYLALNVAFQTPDSPDPVLQLRDQFDTWRAGKAGVVDAVRTGVNGPERLPLPVSGGGRTFTLSISPRDLDGLAISPDQLAISAEAVGGRSTPSASPALGGELPADGFTVEQVRETPTGFEIDVYAESPGATAVRVVLEDDVGHTVELMPRPVVRAVRASADFNGDGVVNFSDVTSFLFAFRMHDPAADFNNDGVFNFYDVQLYLGFWGA